MIQPGKYVAKIIDAQIGFASTGNEQVAVQLELKETGDRITWWGYFSERAYSVTHKALRACGWTGDDLSDLSMVPGNEVRAVVVHEQGLDGEPRARVRWLNSLAGAPVMSQTHTPMSAREFAQRMKARVLEEDRALGVQTPRKMAVPAQQQSPAGQADDDIPF